MGAVRILAGFEPESRRSFHIHRDAVQPPPELVQLVFPGLDMWKQKHSDSHNLHGVQQTYSATEFLKVMDYLRTVFLQDSVFLMEAWPHLGVWSDPLFHTTCWQTWATRLKAATEHSIAERASFRSIDHVVPQLAEALHQVQQDVQSSHAKLESSVLHKLDKLLEPVERKVEHVNDRLDKVDTVYDMLRSGFVLRPAQVAGPSEELQLAAQSESQEVTTSLTPANSHPSVSVGTAMTATVVQPPKRKQRDPPPHEYPYRSMDRSVTTVPQLWREWTEGTATRLPVQEMDERYGRKWLEDESAKTWHKRRRVIITYVSDNPVFAADGPWAAVKAVEDERGHMTLDKFSKELSKRARARRL